MTIPVGTTVIVQFDRGPVTGTVVRVDPDFFDKVPGDGEVAFATVSSSFPYIVPEADCEVVA